MEILLLLQVPLALMVLYLDVLTVAAVIGLHTPAPAPPRSRFAVLVPAHNEEKLLPRLLQSLAAVEYPRQLYDVHVVADNCTDRTAALAAAAGATVHERRNERLRGKGYALQWLVARLRQAGMQYDAYAIVDADSILSANFLAVMNNHLARGHQAIQSHDGVLNGDDSWVSGLSYVALALFNHLRPRGKEALGFSVGLRGNGMCFASAVIERFGWETFGLAEDHAYHLQLVSAGIRVRYAAEASALAEQPTSLQQAYSQSLRWERSRLPMLLTSGPHLLLQAIRRRDPGPLDTLAEQFVPPLSLLAGSTMFVFLLAAVFRMPAALVLASCLVLGETAYVLIGLLLAGAKRSLYLALLRAPFYVVWKLWTIVVANVHLGDTRWIRTARTDEKTYRA
jgi:cellulose synthase/poly-beta-1,6-N-acetylglucosamine synthase-like glycosyltransferase